MRIAIIGCGHMGKGLAERLSLFHSLQLHDRNWALTQEVARQVNGKACQHSSEAIQAAEIIFLAIKPQNLNEFSQSNHTFLQANQMIISLLAGTPLSHLKHLLPLPILVRIMPNLAMCDGKGVIGIVNSHTLSDSLKMKLEELLQPLGMVYWLKEEKMHALTSLSGSGPAFIFALIEAMVEAGIAMGFQAGEAQLLIQHMIKGCLALLEKTNEHPSSLKWKIASPQGTTIAGLRRLEKEGVRSGLIETFLAAYERSQEINQPLSFLEKE